MALTLYGYTKCSTCRNAHKWLLAHERETEFVDMVVQATPSVEVLQELVRKSGLPLMKFFNTSGEVYRELQLKEKLPAMSGEEMLKLLASNGKLIKRPIVTDGQKVSVGFREDEYERTWIG